MTGINKKKHLELIQSLKNLESFLSNTIFTQPNISEKNNHNHETLIDYKTELSSMINVEEIAEKITDLEVCYKQYTELLSVISEQINSYEIKYKLTRNLCFGIVLKKLKHYPGFNKNEFQEFNNYLVQTDK